MIAFMSISNALAFLAEMVHDPTDDKSTLVQVMASKCKILKLSISMVYVHIFILVYRYTVRHVYTCIARLTKKNLNTTDLQSEILFSEILFSEMQWN